MTAPPGPLPRSGTARQGARLLALLAVAAPLPAIDAADATRTIAITVALLGIAAVIPPACALAAYAVALRSDWRAASATIPHLLLVAIIEIVVAHFSWHLAVLLYALMLMVLPCEIWRKAESAWRLPLMALSVIPTVVSAALVAVAFAFFTV